MTKFAGMLKKMRVKLTDPVDYWLRIGEHDVYLNELLDKRIHLHFIGEIHCIQCGRKTNKSFQQGHCFPCMRRINECDNCMLHPERCHVEEGTCPKDDWAHAQCYQSHIVYLANTSGLKIGITRETQVPTRWIDQGAVNALPIIRVQNRRQAGLVEVAFKKFVYDKTNWRAMLKNDITKIDLNAERARLFLEAEDALTAVCEQYGTGTIEVLDAPEIVSLNFPVIEYPTKVSSLSFDKTPEISGVLRGIKGQYLLLDNGVLNIRKFGGYLTEFDCN